MPPNTLRIVTFNFHPLAFRSVRNWIENSGHTHILAVTTPGPLSRPTPSYTQIVEAAPRNVDVLITTRIKSVATPLIRELKPDIILSFSFPYRITPELCALPTVGAVNLHPAVLPSYRGPNAMRPFYDGAPVYGATLHWIAEEYDTGNILSQKSAPTPDVITQETVELWFELIGEAMTEGIERAIAGDSGDEQNHAEATYAAEFTDDEHWLDWQEPKQTIKRKESVLNLFENGSVKAEIAGRSFRVLSLEPLKSSATVEPPGTVIEQSDKSVVMQVADGQVRIIVEPLVS